MNAQHLTTGEVARLILEAGNRGDTSEVQRLDLLLWTREVIREARAVRIPVLPIQKGLMELKR